MNYDQDVQRVLVSESQIQERIGSLALEISKVSDGTPLVLIGVMKGAMLFLADLARQLKVPVELEFITAQSYHGGTESSGTVKIISEVPEVRGRNVLLVDDILDTGRTLALLVEKFRALGASQVHSCVLLQKKKVRAEKIQADFVGFEIEDEFVIGYGLDYQGLYRNLPYIGVLNPS